MYSPIAYNEFTKYGITINLNEKLKKHFTTHFSSTYIL